MLDQLVYTTPEFKAQSKNFVFCKIDIINQPDEAKPYNISAVPDIKFLKADGTIVHSFLGYQPVAGVLKDMEIALGKK